MATKSYTGIKAILIEKLTALLGVDGEELFVQVAGSNLTKPDGYPICYVVDKAGGGNIVDTHRNQRIWEFAVVIHYAIGDETEETADVAILDAVDRVVQMFDRDPMLLDIHGQEQCKKVEVTPVLTERANQDVAIVRSLLTVRVFDLVQRYT